MYNKIKHYTVIVIILLVSSQIAIGFNYNVNIQSFSEPRSEGEMFSEYIKVVLEPKLDFNTRVNFANMIREYYKTDIFSIGLVASAIAEYYNGKITFVNRAFFIETSEFNLILGHGEDSEGYTIGGVDPFELLVDDKKTILAACDSDQFTKLSPNIVGFSGKITILTVLTYLLSKYSGRGGFQSLLKIYDSPQVTKIFLDVKPGAFLITNPFVIQPLLSVYAQTANLAISLEALSLIVSTLGYLSPFVIELVDALPPLRSLVIFLLKGNDNNGAYHINKKIKNGQYGPPTEAKERITNKFIARPLMVPFKPVLVYKVWDTNFVKLHVIWQVKCKTKNGTSGFEVFGIVLRPSQIYKILTIHTLRRGGACKPQNSNAKTALNAINTILGGDLKRRHQKVNFGFSPVPAPIPVPVPKPITQKEPQVLTTSQQNQIWEQFLKPILFAFFVATKVIIDAVKYIDNIFIDWGGGRGSSGHIGYWALFITLLITIALIIANYSPWVSINIGRFLVPAGKYMAYAVGAVAAAAPVTTQGLSQPPPTDSVAYFVIDSLVLPPIHVTPNGSMFLEEILTPNYYNPFLFDTDSDGIYDFYEEKYWNYTNDMISKVNSQFNTNLPLVPESQKFVYMSPSDDWDNDGLNNSLEFMLNTHPWLKDTDADGLSDGEEYFPTMGNPPSDPASPDTDGDFLPDDLERAWGTDPQLYDTDGDGFNDAWELYTDKVLGWKPVVICQGAAGCGYLPLDPTRSMYDAAFANDDSDNDGLNNSMEAMYYTNPISSDSDGDGISDFRELFPYGLGSEVRSNVLPEFLGFYDQYGYVPATNPAFNDTDGDGYLDRNELTSLSSPTIDHFTPTSDIDEDGMQDWWEFKYKLDPYMDDSLLDPDNDGLNNLQEFVQAKNPTIDDVFPTVSNVFPTGTTITYSSSYRIAATGNDYNGISKINLQIFYFISTPGGPIPEPVPYSLSSTSTNIAPTSFVYVVNNWYYSSSFNYYWDTRNLDRSKTYYISIDVYDKAMNRVNIFKTMSFDNNGPSISIVSHYSGQTVSGTTLITASANDPSGVTHVNFYLDSVLKFTDYTSTYSWSWDTTLVSNGYHTIMVTGFDNYGNSRSTSMSLYVYNYVYVPPPSPPLPYPTPF